MKANNLKSKKYWIAVILFLGWFVSYLDRFLINFALPYIGEEFHVNEATLGITISIFFLGYALVQIPGGWLSDKLGSRKVMILSIAMFSLFSMGTGFAWSIASLVVLRFLFGVFEGPFPTASFKGSSEVFPKTEIARVQSTLLASNPLSVAIAPLVAAPLILWMGWRGMFVLMSSFGLIVAVLVFLYFRPAVQAQTSQPKESGNKVPFKVLLANKNIWLFAAINFGINILIWGFLSWLPSYMVKVQKLDLLQAGFLASLPGFSGILGMLVGGWLVDKFFDNRQKYLLIGSILISVLCLVIMINTSSLALAITCQITMFFWLKLAFSTLWSLPLKLLDSSIMGSATGIVNLGSQLAGVVAPAAMGFIITAFNGSYNAAFMFLIFCAILSAIISMTLPSNKKPAETPITTAV